MGRPLSDRSDQPLTAGVPDTAAGGQGAGHSLQPTCQLQETRSVTSYMLLLHLTTRSTVATLT